MIDIDGPAVRRVGDETDSLGIYCDVADSASAEMALAQARAAHGASRVLVHCVGRGHSAPIVAADGPIPLDDFRRLVEVNLISTFNMTRLAATEMARLEPMANGERGVILSTASVSA